MSPYIVLLSRWNLSAHLLYIALWSSLFHLNLNRYLIVLVECFWPSEGIFIIFWGEEKGSVQKMYGSFCYISLKFGAKTQTKENFESSALHLELHISGMSFFAAEKGAKSLHSTSIEILSIFFSLFGTWTYFLPFLGFFVLLNLA